MDCGQAVARIMQSLMGSLPARDRAALLKHLVGCEACRREQDALGAAWERLASDGDDAAEVTPAFAAVVIPRLRTAVGNAAARRGARRVQRTRVAAWSTGMALAVAAALVVVARRHPALPMPPVAAAPSLPTQAAARAEAAGQGFASMPESLAAFVADPMGDGAARTQAIAMVVPHFGGAAEPPLGLVDALTRTLRADRNPGVRKKAAQALAALQSTPAIRAAFIQALRREPNPAIRIIAVEALGKAARGFDPDSIEILRERADDQKESRNLRTRAARALGTIAL
jgi:hypothetical protein